jgi:membrane-bound lytic murein transglycosylase B
MRIYFSFLFALSLVISVPVQANYATKPETKEFIAEMVQKHDFDADRLRALFAETEYKQSIIDAITRPAESKPWYQYRPIFVTQKRIRQGVEFWNRHADLLARAEKEFGIPAAILVAIIGVETRYGRHTGSYRVMDSLATLAFDYPKRSKFFRGQLEEFLLMAREEGVEPLSLSGSYAGAMGQPQFIASSFRAYAVDYDKDGRRDLWNSTADVVGSVANYFSRHHWSEGEAIATRAKVRGDKYKQLLEKGIKPSLALEQLHDFGVNPIHTVAPGTEVALLELETGRGYEYWVALHNFYVITRYNHSPLYAMAVFQLSEAIKSTRAVSN